MTNNVLQVHFPCERSLSICHPCPSVATPAVCPWAGAGPVAAAATTMRSWTREKLGNGQVSRALLGDALSAGGRGGGQLDR